MNKELKKLVFQSIALAMGVATLVLNILEAVEIKSSIIFLSIGVICLALNQFENKGRL